MQRCASPPRTDVRYILRVTDEVRTGAHPFATGRPASSTLWSRACNRRGAHRCAPLCNGRLFMGAQALAKALPAGTQAAHSQCNGRPEQGCAPLCKEVRLPSRLSPLHSKFESSCAGVRRSLQRRAACSPHARTSTTRAQGIANLSLAHVTAPLALTPAPPCEHVRRVCGDYLDLVGARARAGGRRRPCEAGRDGHVRE